MNIYKQMNMIDDNNSLDKRRNIKNQREVEYLKEDIQKLDETSPLVKEIQEYIHDNIFEWDTIGFENDHIYVVFDEDTEEHTIDSCEEELEDEFGHACELVFELENENTLLIYVSISDEVDDENYEWFVEHQVDYSLRAKDAQIIERDYGYEFLWISQEGLSEDDAYELAVATNNYLVHLNKVGKLVKGTCYCRSYPEDDYKVQFTVKEDLRFADVEDATVYEYGIIDDSEYFEEEYTTDWNEALETFNKVAHRVQERLLDMDDEEYDDYYSDGVAVRVIKGKEGSDAFNWDTIREVTVFRDSIENEQELEESLTEEKEYSDIGIIKDKWEISQDDYGEINDDTIKIIRKYYSPDDIECWYWKKDYSGDRPCYLVIETTDGDMIQFEEHGGSLFQIDKDGLDESMLTEANKNQEITKIMNYLQSKGYHCTPDRDTIRVQFPSGKEYDVILEPTGTSQPSGTRSDFTSYKGDGTVVKGQLYDTNNNLIGRAGVSIIKQRNDKDYRIKNIDKVII